MFQLSLFVCVQTNASDLLVLCGELEEAVEDRAGLRYLKKFRESLVKICPPAQAPTGER